MNRVDKEERMHRIRIGLTGLAFVFLLVLLGTAMAAVGLNTSLAVFKGIGAKPFAVGFAGAVVVGAVGLTMAVILGRFAAL